LKFTIQILPLQLNPIDFKHDYLLNLIRYYFIKLPVQILRPQFNRFDFNHYHFLHFINYLLYMHLYIYCTCTLFKSKPLL